MHSFSARSTTLIEMETHIHELFLRMIEREISHCSTRISFPSLPRYDDSPNTTRERCWPDMQRKYRRKPTRSAQTRNSIRTSCIFRSFFSLWIAMRCEYGMKGNDEISEKRFHQKSKKKKTSSCFN